MARGETPPGGNGPLLTVDEVRVVEGVAREPGRVPCPACGRPVCAGDSVATSLGDVRRGAVGVTVHARCFTAVGVVGLLELMKGAYAAYHV